MSIKERLQALLATKQKNDEAWSSEKATKPQPREYIERVELDVGPNVHHVRYKWINTIGNVIGWYSAEELRAMRLRYIELAELPLAPGVADEIRRMVATIDDALGDEVVPPPNPFIGANPDQ